MKFLIIATAALALQPVHPVRRSCGLEPKPPIGCQVNTCVCDDIGSNCKWLFICGYCCGEPYHYGNVLDWYRKAPPYPRAGAYPVK
jgi:hypothetical protein